MLFVDAHRFFVSACFFLNNVVISHFRNNDNDRCKDIGWMKHKTNISRAGTGHRRFSIVTGPMFVGKTKTLIDDMIHASHPLLIKKLSDNRYDDKIKKCLKHHKKDIPWDLIYKNDSSDDTMMTLRVGGVMSHDGIFFPALEVSTLTLALAESLNGPSLLVKSHNHCVPYRIDHIGIDEAQFFGYQLPPFVRHLFIVKRINLTVAGLTGDFNLHPFGNIGDIQCMATEYHFLKGRCSHCYEEESSCFTLKYDNNDDDDDDGGKEGSIVDVGGEEKYYSVCPLCLDDINRGKYLSILLGQSQRR